MFNFIYNIFKVGLVAVGVLLAGAWIQWDGKTLSQHVSTRFSKIVHSGGMDKIMGTLRENIPQSNIIGPATGISIKGMRKPGAKEPIKSKVTGEIYSSEKKQLNSVIEKNIK